MNKNKDKKSLFGSIFKKKVNLNEYDATNEKVLTPWQTVFQNFKSNKLGIVGLIGFLLLVLVTFVGSVLNPIDLNYQNPTMKNLSPGKNYLKFPKELNGHVSFIDSGKAFSVALSDEGKLYFWGQDVGDVISKKPDEIKDETFKNVLVGDAHIIAQTTGGNLIGWGNNEFLQAQLNPEVDTKIQKGIQVKKMIGSELLSSILFEDGNLVVWGVNAEGYDVIPKRYKDKITDYSFSAYNGIVILKDKTAGTIGKLNNDFSKIPEDLTNGKIKSVKSASALYNGLILDENGKLHQWGSSHFENIPEIEGKVIDIAAFRNTFVALSENGKIYAWGNNDLGEKIVPTGKKFTKIFANNFQAYAIDEDGDIHAWGNKGYLLGSDELGRDLYKRLLHGGKITMFVGIVAVVISTIIGVIVGLISGFVGGWVDNLLMRLAEIVSTIPFLPLIITLSYIIGTRLDTTKKMYLVMVIIGVTSWIGLARLIRGQILIEREKDFVLAARALGIKEKKIIIKHILPNIINYVIVSITLTYASTMLVEAGLSFLGFGVQSPIPSWGNMLDSAKESSVIRFFWWRWVIPASCVLFAALCVNLIGDALRDAMDPKANEK